MASKTAILSVRVVTDATKAQAGLDQTASAVGKLESGLSKAKGPALAATAAIGALAKSGVDAASDLQQSSGAVESVFGSQAAAIIAASESAADAVGLSESAYQNLAATFGAQLTNMGLSTDQVSGQTQKLIGLGSDLAATFGGSTADAVSAISALLRGERDPIEQYGVSIKDADIKARMAAQGLSGLSGEAAKQAQTQTVLAMLMEQSGGAVGQFARETDTAAGSQQIANANWENARATLGEKLLPVVTQFTQGLTAASQWVQQHSTAVTVLVGVVGGLAAAVLLANGALSAYKAVQTAVRVATVAGTAAQQLLNAALRANPVGLVVTAIAALAAGLVYAYQHSETFRNTVNRAWEAVKSGASAVWNALQPIRTAFSAIADAVSNAYTWVKNLFSNFHAPEWLSKIGSLVGLAAGDGTIDVTGGGYIPAPAPTVAATRAGKSTPVVHQTTINLTVNGAVDADATGRQLVRILSAHQRRHGTVTLGAA